MTDETERPSERTFRDLRDALEGRGDDVDFDGQARIDATRVDRKGVPEVIFAAGKRPEQVLEIARAMLNQSFRAIVSRVDDATAELLRIEFAGDEFEQRSGTRTIVVRRQGFRVPATGGAIAIITAGTSDLSLAEDARIIAEEMGCDVRVIADVGVAGLHRLMLPLQRVLDDGVDVIVVVAGMDGALPSVVAGLVPVPVIGLPTSTGYGYGGNGQAALMSMLQTCVPGLIVVNIDNGVGAGASAALIANAIARARAR